MKMDVSKFKKVSSDKKKTVLKHPRGHEIVIAHSSVSPSTRKQLADLPHYAYGSKDVGGGEDPGVGDNLPDWATKPVYQQVSEAASNDSPELSREQTQQFMANPDAPYVKDYPDKFEAAKRYYGMGQPEVADNKYTADVPPLGADQDKYKAQMDSIRQQEGPVSGDDPSASVDPTGGQPEEAAPLPQQEEPPQAAIQGDRSPADEAAKDKGAQQNYQKGFEDYHRENAQKLGVEDAAWQHDLQNGHVTPETYHDLFAKRDTLGKIGMLFGLLVSGAGAGLAHQSNAVMDAMNKEIENDFNAQKQSKDNAQNFLKIHQQQALNDAEIKRVNAGIPLTEAEAQKARAEASVLGQSAALMKMNRVGFHEQALRVQAMPPGPDRINAERALALLGQAIDAKNMNVADVAASKAAFVRALGGGGDGGGEQGFQNNQKFLLGSGDPNLAKIAEYNQETHIPGVGQASGPVPQEKKNELEAMNVLDYKAKDLLGYAKQHKGSLDPSVRAVGAQKAEEMMNYYNNSIKGGVMTEGRLKWLDQQIKKNPTTIFQDILGNNARMNEIMESNSQRRNIMLQNLGAPQTPPPSIPQEHVSRSGRAMIQKNGKWYYK